MEPTGRAEDFAEYWQAQPTETALDANTSVQVVGKRCVYVNDYRIAGGKPYYSENLPNHGFETTIRSCLEAFPDHILAAALREREARKAYIARWHLAKKQLETSHD